MVNIYNGSLGFGLGIEMEGQFGIGQEWKLPFGHKFEIFAGLALEGEASGGATGAFEYNECTEELSFTAGLNVEGTLGGGGRIAGGIFKQNADADDAPIVGAQGQALLTGTYSYPNVGVILDNNGFSLSAEEGVMTFGYDISASAGVNMGLGWFGSIYIGGSVSAVDPTAFADVRLPGWGPIP